jgi:hypothetical protein
MLASVSFTGSDNRFEIENLLSVLSSSAPVRARPSGPIEMNNNGGSREATVKNENGARFDVPSASHVDTQAMGLGRTTDVRTL